MKKAYIITAGAYSAYRILAVFSSSKLAQGPLDGIKKAFPGEDVKIEEYALDVGVTQQGNPRGLMPFDVIMKQNGDTESVELSTDLISNKEPLLQYAGTILFNVLATDEKHAVKICNEQRAQLIANNEWPPMD